MPKTEVAEITKDIAGAERYLAKAKEGLELDDSILVRANVKILLEIAVGALEEAIAGIL